jgi:hypothetical protein
MKNLAEDFKEWALDPKRTNEELFTLELLLEKGRVVWGWKHKNYGHDDWDAKRAHSEERRLNPAYRAVVNREYLDCTVEIWEKFTDFSPNQWNDRPVRDISALRFFPQLETVHLRECEVADFSPLAAMRGLKSVQISEPNLLGGYVVENLDALAGLPALENLHIGMRTPWPDLRFLATLPALRVFSCRINLLALRDVAALPEVEVASLDEDFHCSTPVRSLLELPEMPLLRNLKLKSVASLEGIGRSGRLTNLEVEGPFRDLTPLASLREMTFVKLTGELFTDLSPLARAPSLREIVLNRERPLDVSPLAEAPELRELRVERCPILATEVAALNAALHPWSGDFMQVPPRPLGPLRFVAWDRKDEVYKAESLRRHEVKNRVQLEKAAREDPAFRAAESRWFKEELQTRLERLLGVGWGIANSTHVRLRRYCDVMRFREIVQTLRELNADCKEPKLFLLIVEPHGDMSEDMEAIRARQKGPVDWLDRPFNAAQEIEERERFRRERLKDRQYLEREHRLKLQQQQGLDIDPADFSPSADEPPASKQKAIAGGGEEAEDESIEDENDGGVADMPPDDGKTESDLAEDLGFYATLNEEGLFVATDEAENAACVMGEEPVFWSSLPEPPEKRPMSGW